jgi:transposase
MEEKMRFVSLAESGRFEVVGLCREFGISRKTGYKWLGRYREFGSEGLRDQSRAPKSQAGKTEAEVEVVVVTERRRHPTWGPKKIGRILEVKYGLERVPALSTIGEILKRNGMVEARRRRPGEGGRERFRWNEGSCRRRSGPIRFGRRTTKGGFILGTGNDAIR